MSITRGEFLKSLKKSLPGMVLGGGIATVAQKVLSKMAAASGVTEIDSTTSSVAKSPARKEEEIPFIKSGPTDGNRIALTFDDGPTPGVTDRILDELKRRQLHASFFMIGERIAAEPDLARRVLAEGHDVCNHTYTHPDLTKLPAPQVEAEIQKTEDIMAEVLNHRAKWFRPPYGALRQNQAVMLAQRNLGIILWNVNPADWSQPGEDKIIGTILGDTNPGSIIVCHDLHQQTTNALGTVLDGLFERGFTLATLTELLG